MENARAIETTDRCDSCRFVYADIAASAIPARLAAFRIRSRRRRHDRIHAADGTLRARLDGITNQVGETLGRLGTACRLLAESADK